ncbi:MAG: hypothetical protein AAF570_03475, partial [Bacteroidota bacterium]
LNAGYQRDPEDFLESDRKDMAYLLYRMAGPEGDSQWASYFRSSPDLLHELDSIFELYFAPLTDDHILSRMNETIHGLNLIDEKLPKTVIDSIRGRYYYAPSPAEQFLRFTNIYVDAYEDLYDFRFESRHALALRDAFAPRARGLLDGIEVIDDVLNPDADYPKIDLKVFFKGKAYACRLNTRKKPFEAIADMLNKILKDQDQIERFVFIDNGSG